jgi:hypothetical protein
LNPLSSVILSAASFRSDDEQFCAPELLGGSEEGFKFPLSNIIVLQVIADLDQLDDRRSFLQHEIDFLARIILPVIELEIGLPAFPPEKFYGNDVFIKPACIGGSPSREAMNLTRIDGIDLARSEAFLLDLEGELVDLEDKIAFFQEGKVILDRMNALEPEDVFQFCGRHPAGKTGDEIMGQLP